MAIEKKHARGVEIIYGVHPVSEALASARRRFYEIYTPDQKPTRRLEAVLTLAESKGIPVKTLPRSQFHALTGTDHSQGVAAKVGAYPFAAILKVRESILVPIILVISFVGAYAVNSSLFDVGLALIFGVMGYLLNKFAFPLPPILMGIILGPIAEEGLRQSLMVSEGSWSILVTRPISAAFLIVTTVILVRKIYVLIRQKDST